MGESTAGTQHVVESTRLILVRHGQMNWNLEGRYQGCSDVPLNAAGLKQAEQLAAELADHRLDAVYASALSRAVETARIVAAQHNLTVRADPRLNEINQGEWEGMLSPRIAEAHPELFRQWNQDARLVCPPGGESIGEFHDRVVTAVQEIVAAHPGGTLCLVTHKVAIVSLRCHYLGAELREEMAKMPANARWESLEVDLERCRLWSPGVRCCSAVA